MTKKVLLISNSEICYNPRLAKAADSLSEQGYDVDVFNPVVGMADMSVYKNFIKDKKWNVREFDISKQNLKSKINWIFVSIINKLFWFLYKNFNTKAGFEYIKNKGLLGFSKNKKKYDVLIVHLVDSLPFAAKLKKKYKNAALIYDSQEFFTGQYSKAPYYEKKWVNEAEKKYIYDADIVLATTNVMSEKILKKYKLKEKPLRVRNLPYLRNVKFKNDTNNPVKLVWHGMRIIFKNRRGLHILLEAMTKINSEAELYIQGLISDEEKQKIKLFTEKNNIKNKIKILSPAPPDKIVDSLKTYDIGLIGELPEEENQLLTSSNKLFEFISAGLAVIIPDIPGLKETAEEFECCDIYKPGDSDALAEKIDLIIQNSEKLKNLKQASQNSARHTLFWNNDYKFVAEKLEKIFLFKEKSE